MLLALPAGGGREGPFDRLGGRNCPLPDDPRLRAGCAAELDVGRLPGIASTVLDFTGPEPRVLREGAAPSAEALARVRTASS